MSKFLKNVDENRNVVLGLDANEDGEASVTAKLILSEMAQELLKKGEKIEGKATVDFSMTSRGFAISLDTDEDGEPSIIVEGDLGEAFDEIT